MTFSITVKRWDALSDVLRFLLLSIKE
jgi:hypothetical protein